MNAETGMWKAPVSLCIQFFFKYSHLPLLQEASRRGAHSPEICASVFLAGKLDYLLIMFDSVVILACFTSLILCTRSVINGIQLQFVSKEE